MNPSRFPPRSGLARFLHGRTPPAGGDDLCLNQDSGAEGAGPRSSPAPLPARKGPLHLSGCPRASTGGLPAAFPPVSFRIPRPRYLKCIRAVSGAPQFFASPSRGRCDFRAQPSGVCSLANSGNRNPEGGTPFLLSLKGLPDPSHPHYS